MGLAGPRNRTKISADPRNTVWSNNTTRFGHRILTTLGWTPGNTLGDTSSQYHQSGHITTASAAGVKIVLKDDNLGIGCDKRQREDVCVGLDGLQNLLGRLNGKGCEELEKENESRQKVKRETIVGERYGMRFVRGETYVSSDIEALLKKIEGEKKQVEARQEVGVKEPQKERRKKRKEIKVEAAKSGEDIEATRILDDDSVEVKEEKKEKRSKSSTKSTSATPAPDDGTDFKSQKRKRSSNGTEESTRGGKEKKSRKSRNGETHDERKERRARERREKETRKEERKKRKKRKTPSDSSGSEDESTTTTTPAASGTATPTVPMALVGRQAVRHRYIAAKRSAVMDAKALNEIFMIKT